MSTQTPFPGFRCEECGAISVRIDGPLSDLAPVRCTGCGHHLGDWCAFLDNLMQTLERRGLPHALSERRKLRSAGHRGL